MHKLIKKVTHMSNLSLLGEEKHSLNMSKIPIKQNHLDTSHIYFACMRQDERLRVKYYIINF